MAKVLRSMLFSSIILLIATPAPSSLQLPPAPSPAAEPLGLTPQTPPAPSSVAELLGSTARTPPAPSPGALSGGYEERVTASEFDEQDVETIGFLSGFDGKQKAGAALMLLGGSGLLVYGGWLLCGKVRPGSSRRRRLGSLGQPRKFWME
ncbi:hypothetical protein ACJRO7_004164 [Eucalyptus globulus]|uniref:Transmembrane protein n=1 Tax=Eucalyptus globulus TaxID=34317 RepID=A0ABD3IW19_EUCGL